MSRRSPKKAIDTRPSSTTAIAGLSPAASSTLVTGGQSLGELQFSDPHPNGRTSVWVLLGDDRDSNQHLRLEHGHDA